MEPEIAAVVGSAASDRSSCYIVVMTNASNPIRTLSDDHLLRHVQQLAADERSVIVQLIAALAELDGRRLYLAAGCSSLFTYCTQILRLSEHAAYGRIEAARAARRYPVVLELLAHGEITLTTITLLAGHLTPDNHRDVLDAARRKSRRDVERLVASLHPRPEPMSAIRKLPEAHQSVSPSATSPAATDRQTLREPSSNATESPLDGPMATPAGIIQSARAVIAPLTPHRYRIQLTVSVATHDKLRRVQDLMRHTLPDGDPAAILDRALTLLLEQLESRKLAVSTKPRAPSDGTSSPVHTRYIPASIRRTVWARDGGRCAFVGTQGRCTERGFLEFHHRKAFAEGGLPSVDNLELRCRPHNQFEAEQLFGPWPDSVRTELDADESARGRASQIRSPGVDRIAR